MQFDSIGLSLLVIVMVSWEVMLSKGQEWDWLGDPFWRVQTLALLFIAGLAALIWWELRHRSPIVNFRPLRDRNFAACCIIIFCAYLALYASSTLLPGLLQSLFGYDALSAGLVMSPAGFFAVLAMPIVGRLLGKGVDARWLITAGLVGHDRRQLLDVAVQSGRQPGTARLAAGGADRGVGGMLCPGECRGLSLYTLGVARRGRRLVESSAQRRRQRRDVARPNLPGAARSIPHLAPRGIPRPVQRRRAIPSLDTLETFFLQQSADPVASQERAWQMLENLRQQQAASLAYFDCFWIFAVLTLGARVRAAADEAFSG